MEALNERDHHVEQALVCGRVTVLILVFVGRSKERGRLQLLVVSSDNDALGSCAGGSRVLLQADGWSKS
jgi:hypothetical protein